MKKWVKNIVIVALAALCVYQTGRLWFDGAPRLNFLYVLGFNQVGGGHDATVWRLSVPRRILISEGGAIFTAAYSAVADTPQFAAGRDLIGQVLRNAEYHGTFHGADIRWGMILGGEAFVLDYGFSMPATAFAAALDAPHGVISSQIDNFNMVVLTPWLTGTMAFFVDSLSGDQRASYFWLDGCARADGLYAPLERGRNLIYRPSELVGRHFVNMIFLPQSLPGGYNYAPAVAVSPMDDYHLNTQNVARLVMPFFDNPNVVLNDLRNFEFIFNDTHTIVRYQDTFHLYYQSWRPWRSRQPDTLEMAFAEALLFMERDESLINEFYLARFAYNGNEFRFYFNYIFNDLPIFLEERLRDQINMDAAIEITVANGRVTRYKRYAMGFVPHHTRPPARANITYQAPINAWGVHDQSLHTLYLTYVVDIPNSIIGLFYIAPYEGGQLTFPAR